MDTGTFKISRLINSCIPTITCNHIIKIATSNHAEAYLVKVCFKSGTEQDLVSWTS